MLAWKQRALHFSGAIETLLMGSDDLDRNRRRPRLTNDFGSGRLMASGKRERGHQRENWNNRKQLHGSATMPLRKSSTTASASDSIGLAASLSSRRRSDPVSISQSMKAANWGSIGRIAPRSIASCSTDDRKSRWPA